MAVVFIGGGARSGKSGFAQRWIEERRGGGVYIATGQAGDDEMRARIARHQADRDAAWRTVEEPLELAGTLRSLTALDQAILVDCLTLWLSNVMLHSGRDAEREIEILADLLRTWNGPDLVLVSNEVGCGIVPENALAREFRDLAGRLNQGVAEAADEVYWTVFGIPLRVKPAGGST